MMRQFILGIFLLSLFCIHQNLFCESDFYEIEEESFQASDKSPLEVKLDVDAGEVDILKGTDPLSGSIYMEYQSRKFRSKIDFKEDKNRLHVVLDVRNWHKLSNIGNDDDTVLRVEIRLPYAVDILLDAKVKAGEINMELGGLRVKEFYFNNWAGEVNVSFDEPNPIVMEYFDMNARVGELQISRLGNARFLKANINGGIGEIDVDFTGALVPGSKAKVDHDIGEASIILPDDIDIRMAIGGTFSFMSHKDIDGFFHRRGRYYYSEDYDEHKEAFSIRVTPGLGELRIDCV